MPICLRHKTPLLRKWGWGGRKAFHNTFHNKCRKGHGLTTLGSVKFELNAVWSTRWCPYLPSIVFLLIWYGDSAVWTKAAWNTHNVVERKHSNGHAYSSSTQNVITNFHSTIRSPNSTIRLYHLRKAVRFVWKADAKRIAEDVGSHSAFPDTCPDVRPYAGF